MAEVLGDQHPRTLFSCANYANVLADQERLAEAWDIEQRATDALRTVLGPQHPETVAVVSNSALTLDALGRADEARSLREEALGELNRQLRQLGDDNGISQFAHHGRRIYRDLEPLAV